MEIRNFCIISHIDHGKSTLADRFLELTGAIDKKKFHPQYLDMMDLEQEKGITIKLQPVRMIYKRGTQNEYVLNLIDTPGHMDFSYEVSRALAAVEGTILLVDVLKGIQAQTLANLETAKKENLVIIPVINKIDLASEFQIKEVENSLSRLLKIKLTEILKISAKHGTNVEELLRSVIEKIPNPPQETEKPLKALIFDSCYDVYKGIKVYIRVIEGKVELGEKIYFLKTQTESQVKEIGYFKPDFSPQKRLLAGEIGYIATGIKEPEKIKIGDTITRLIDIETIEIEPLAGYQEPQVMVFTGLYPVNSEDYSLLKQSLAKLKLNDPSFIFQPSEISFARGFLAGFLGPLHSEIVIERLKREYGIELLITSPSVTFKIIKKNNEEVFVSSLSQFPEFNLIKEIFEPWVKLEIITPNQYLGVVLKLIRNIKGRYQKTEPFDSEKVLLIYEIPLRELMGGFYNNLKNISQGYASLNYEFIGFQKGDLVKINILIAGQKEEALARIVPREKAYSQGVKIVKKLKEILPPQLFTLPLQAEVEGKIIARETIRAKRKDVVAPLYGGDYTRKRKLLEKQKKGKKKLFQRGIKIKIPPKVFLEMFKS